MDEVVRAIHDAAAGEIVLDPQDLSSAMREMAQDRERRRDIDLLVGQLSPREREVLSLLVQGATNDDIARKLHLSVETVRTHVRNLLRKLGVHSKLEAAAFAIRHRVVDVGS
jgi:RNA polymerase sigma factor (sigma-70 family)